MSFVDWLEAGAPGMLPGRVRAALGGPAWVLLPLAQRVAQAVGPWLLALLTARQQAGLVGLAGAESGGGREASRLLGQDIQMRPLGAEERERKAGWLTWGLEAELLRLVRLSEAPPELLYRPGWDAYETRYWALVISLARIGQFYGMLKRRAEGEAEARWLEAAGRVWQRATCAEERRRASGVPEGPGRSGVELWRKVRPQAWSGSAMKGS